MKHVVLLLAVAFLFAAAPGCKMTPEKICNKFQELAKKKAGDKKFDEAKLKKKTERCVEEMKKMEEKQPDFYKCSSACVKDANSLDDAKGCYGKCKDKIKK